MWRPGPWQPLRLRPVPGLEPVRAPELQEEAVVAALSPAQVHAWAPPQVCRALPLARGDYAYARAVSERLDAALRAVARQTDVELVDLWEASEGHDVCSDDPWVNGSETDLSAALEYHPFAAGQRAAADLVVVAATSVD